MTVVTAYVRPTWVPVTAKFIEVAKYQGTCEKCSGKILAGTPIWWLGGKGLGVWHADLKACMSQLEKPVAPKVKGPTYEFPSFEALFTMFDSASKKLKYPALEFKNVVGEFTFRIHVTGPSSKYPGSGSLTLKLERGSGKVKLWYGRITRSGEVFIPPGKETEKIADLLKLLGLLSVNPQETVALIGKKSGACCYCGSSLSDPVSLLVGFGPVCATNWGHQAEFANAKKVVAAGSQKIT